MVALKTGRGRSPLNILSPSTSKYQRSSQRAYDRNNAHWWRRLGFGPKLAVMVWTVEDDISSMLADQIRQEIDAEIIKRIMGE